MPPLSSNQRLAILRDDMLADDCETPVKSYMEASRWAADEIERLTAELATMREAHGTYVELYPKVCIERDRLRAALGQAKEGFRAIELETCVDARKHPHTAAWRAQKLALNHTARCTEALAGASDETTAAHEMRCPVHWTYENGLRIRCKKAMGHTGECDLK